MVAIPEVQPAAGPARCAAVPVSAAVSLIADTANQLRSTPVVVLQGVACGLEGGAVGNQPAFWGRPDVAGHHLGSETPQVALGAELLASGRGCCSVVALGMCVGAKAGATALSCLGAVKLP